MSLTRGFIVGAAVVAASLAALPVIAAPAAAGPGVLVTPARVELAIKPDATSVNGQFIVYDSGTVSELVKLSVSDFSISTNGAYQFLPVGSTPYTLSGALELTPASVVLKPSEQATIRYHYTSRARRALAGAILVGMTGAAPTPTSAPGASVALVEQVAVPFLAVPTGVDGSLEALRLSISPGGLSVPILQESGPVTVTARLRNNGDAIGRVDSWATFESFPLGRAFLRTEAPPAVVLPGAIAVTTSDTRVAVIGGPGKVDTTPWICLPCRVTVVSRLILLDQASSPVTQTGYAVIFPWRPVAIVLAIIGGVLWAIRRKRRRSPGAPTVRLSSRADGWSDFELD